MEVLEQARSAGLAVPHLAREGVEWMLVLRTREWEEADELRLRYVRVGFKDGAGREGGPQVKLLKVGSAKDFAVKVRLLQADAA